MKTTPASETTLDCDGRVVQPGEIVDYHDAELPRGFEPVADAPPEVPPVPSTPEPEAPSKKVASKR